MRKHIRTNLYNYTGSWSTGNYDSWMRWSFWCSSFSKNKKTHTNFLEPCSRGWAIKMFFSER